MFQVHKPSPPQEVSGLFPGNMIKHIKAFMRDEDAASAVEYALTLALIATVIIMSVILFGESVEGLFKIAIDAITN